LGSLGTMYDVHLGLIGKRTVDFLLVLIELFSLGVMAEVLLFLSASGILTFWRFTNRIIIIITGKTD